MAAIEALNALKKPCRVSLTTDSVYVRDGITKWIHGWRRNGWKTADRKPVKNAELWQALLDAADAAPGRVALGQGRMPGIPRMTAPTRSPALRPSAAVGPPRRVARSEVGRVDAVEFVGFATKDQRRAEQ